jgi:response regulator RpfG family c-di-GMP phosphodiesterase
MALLKTPRTILIVDPDTSFLESFHKETDTRKMKILTSKKGKDAQLIIADPQIHFVAVFLNPFVKDPPGSSVIRSIRTHKPTTPIYLLLDQTEAVSESEFRNLGVREIIKKPVTVAQILDMTAPVAISFNPDQSLSVGTISQAEPIDSGLNLEDSKFVTIQAEHFLSGSICYFDVYIRLGSDKYVKLLKSGDAFNYERISNYLKKGVKLFYIKKEAQEQYVAYLNQIASGITGLKKVAIETKTNFVLNHGDELLHYFKDQGVTETNLQYASQHIQNVQSLVKTMNLGQKAVFNGFLKDVAAYDHGVGVSLIAGMLLPSLDITSTNTIETVGIPALFHDIGLFQLSFTSEEEEDIPEDQKEKFRSHPIVGAELLKQIRGVSPAMMQGIAQHHERRNKKGYPYKIGPGSLSKIAEIIGLSDEFYRISKKILNKREMSIELEIKTKILDCFSSELVSAFRKVFLIANSN